METAASPTISVWARISCMRFMFVFSCRTRLSKARDCLPNAISLLGRLEVKRIERGEALYAFVLSPLKQKYACLSGLELGGAEPTNVVACGEPHRDALLGSAFLGGTDFHNRFGPFRVVFRT